MLLQSLLESGINCTQRSHRREKSLRINIDSGMHLFAGFVSKEEGFPQENGGSAGALASGRQPWVAPAQDELFWGASATAGPPRPPPASVFQCASSKRNPSCGRGATPRSPEALGQPVLLPLRRPRGQPKTLVPRLFAGGWGFLGERQGAPGVLSEWHAQPGLRGHGGGGEGVVLGLEFELAGAAGQRLVRLALCLGRRKGRRKSLESLLLANGSLCPSA